MIAFSIIAFFLAIGIFLGHGGGENNGGGSGWDYWA